MTPGDIVSSSGGIIHLYTEPPWRGSVRPSWRYDNMLLGPMLVLARCGHEVCLLTNDGIFWSSVSMWVKL